LFIGFPADRERGGVVVGGRRILRMLASASREPLGILSLAYLAGFSFFLLNISLGFYP